MALQLTFAPITTVAAEHLKVPVQAIGWLSQVFTLFYVVLGLPMGVALDRWFRGSLAAGALVTILGAALRLCGDHFAWILAGQLVAAVAQPLLLNGVTKIAGEYLSEKDRPAGIALGMASLYAGELIAIGAGTVFSRPEQVHDVILINSVFAIVSMAALLVFLRRPGEFRVLGAAPAGLASVRELWRDPFMRTVAVLAFLGFGTFTSYMTWLQALLAPAGIAADAAGGMLLGFVLAGIVGAMVIPAWVARHKREFALMLAAVAVGCMVCLLLAVAPRVSLGIIGMPLIGLLQLSTLPVIMEMTERRAGPAAGTASALVWMAGNAGATVISIAIQNMIGRPGLAFLFLASITLASAPLVRILRRFVLIQPVRAIVVSK
ncbi:MAG: major facilitator superfamily 1 [Nevskia sp.]|nr:major facilitator superfamily 1 [Nevskia sp.]